MKKIVVIFYGPPGSGKGTQANLIAQKFNLFHFDTGRFLEDLVHDPARQREKEIRRERALFDKGILMTPSFVLKEVARKVKQLDKAGWGIVFSGSPRTTYEAMALLPLVGKLYGKKNIFIFLLNIPEGLSISRNTMRLVCSVCGHMVLAKYHPLTTPLHCPICAGPLYKRTLDKPNIIRVRLKEYRMRTKPILTMLKKEKYRVRELDASPAPHLLLNKIYDNLKKRLRN